MTSEKKKFMIPLALSLAAFLLLLIANIIGGFSLSFSNLLQLILSAAIPGGALALHQSGSLEKSGKALAIGAAVLLGLELLGTLLALILSLFSLSAGPINWLPGTWLLSSVIAIFRIFANMISWGFDFFFLRLLLGIPFSILSALVYLASGFYTLLLCSEYTDLLPQLNPLRQKLYAKLQLTEDQPSSQPCASESAASSCGSESAQEPTETKTEADKMDHSAPTASPTCVSPELLIKKSIPTAIILSLITCGIYGLVWIYSIMKKIRLLNKDSSGIAGEFLCFLFVTFYAFYWYYTRGARLAEGAGKHGVTLTNNGIMYLLLSVFGLSIISTCLMQNDLNTVADVLTGRAPSSDAGTQATQEFHAAYSSITSSGEPTEVRHAPTSDKDVLEQLEKLNDLHSKGALTEEEFAAAKADLLKRL